jgi:hypothetical protein
MFIVISAANERECQIHEILLTKFAATEEEMNALWAVEVHPKSDPIELAT